MNRPVDSSGLIAGTISRNNYKFKELLSNNSLTFKKPKVPRSEVQQLHHLPPSDSGSYISIDYS